MKVQTYLDCDCAILEDGSRNWCPTCGSLSTPRPQPNRILITVEGGVIQNVEADRPQEVSVVVYDVDNDDGGSFPVEPLDKDAAEIHNDVTEAAAEEGDDGEQGYTVH